MYKILIIVRTSNMHGCSVSTQIVAFDTLREAETAIENVRTARLMNCDSTAVLL